MTIMNATHPDAILLLPGEPPKLLNNFNVPIASMSTLLGCEVPGLVRVRNEGLAGLLAERVGATIRTNRPEHFLFLVIDDMGRPKGLPVNNEASIIYAGELLPPPANIVGPALLVELD